MIVRYLYQVTLIRKDMKRVQKINIKYSGKVMKMKSIFISIILISSSIQSFFISFYSIIQYFFISLPFYFFLKVSESHQICLYLNTMILHYHKYSTIHLILIRLQLGFPQVYNLASQIDLKGCLLVPLRQKQIRFPILRICATLYQNQHSYSISQMVNFESVSIIPLSMIYSSAPAWSLHPKTQEHHQPPTPSPADYHPDTSSTLIKSPSWKMGKETRSKDKRQNSPSPTSYQPLRPQRSRKMGVIGREARTKQNVEPVPGPGSYHIPAKNDTKCISFAKKHAREDKKGCYPGPANYSIPNKRDRRGVVIGNQERFTTQNAELNPGPANYVPSNRPISASTKFAKAPRMSHQPFRNNLVLRPGQNELNKGFDPNLQKPKGYTLGEKQYYSTAFQTPGPADYSPTRQDLQSSPNISFSKKYREREATKSPSPNQYNPQYKNIILKTESYSISKAERQPLYAATNSPGPGAYLKTQYTSTGVEVSVGSSVKKEERQDFPGPGAYNPNKEVILKRPSTAKLGKSQRFYQLKTETSNASFYDSKMDLGSPKYSFSKTKKLDEKYQQGPGPGSYVTPSSLCNLSAYASKA